MRRSGFRSWLAAAAVLPLLLTGCRDERGPVSPPDTGILDGDGIFGTAVVTTAYYAFQNAMVALTLGLHEDPAFNAIVVPSCHTDDPANAARISQDATDEDLYQITFGSGPAFPFITNCGIDQFAFGGTLSVRFLQTEGGLVYEVILPYNHVTELPEAVSLTLPGQFGSFTLRITAPEGPLLCTMESAGARHEGRVHMEGTVRLEDRAQPFLLIQELQLEYELTEPSPGVFEFGRWPSGSYATATHTAPQIGSGLVAAYPTVVTFNGVGGASFELGVYDCDVNLATGENPCENL
ncbi:MAG: hypothetical protein DHS20C21_09090 [Gemmatimonadota bacterium]|nr:MAG: hypothetical protein DHS20C21_09090 [Gemmatimonadota bacterium]